MPTAVIMAGINVPIPVEIEFSEREAGETTTNRRAQPKGACSHDPQAVGEHVPPACLPRL